MLRKLMSPVLLVALIGGIALISVWTQQAWLAPSIAAAAFTQVFSPDQPSAKIYSTFLGQVIGTVAGFAGVFAAGAAQAAKFVGDHDLGDHRVVAIAVAVALTAIAQEALDARSPAGATTAVVVAVGAETATWAGFGRLCGGIALVSAFGEAARRIAAYLNKPTSPKPMLAE